MKTTPAQPAQSALYVRDRDAEDFEENARPLDLGLLVRLFRFAFPHRRKGCTLLAIVLVRSMQIPLLAWSIGAVINGPITAHDTRGVLAGAAGFALLALITQLTMHFRMRLGLEFGEAVIHDLRNTIFAHIQSMTMGFFHRMRTGRLISRVTSDAESVRVGVQEVLFVSMVQGGQMFFSGALMCWYDPLLFAVVLGMAPVIWLINRRFRGRMSRLHRQAQESFSRVTATLAESVLGIRVTQGFARQNVNAGFFRELVRDHSRYNVGAARTTAVFLPLLEMNTQFFIAALLLLGGYRALSPDHAMPLGDLIQFFFLSNLFFEPVRNLGNQYTNSLGAMAGAERVFQLLDTKPDWADPQDAVEIDDLHGRVEFRQVGFEYLPGRPVLEEVSFDVQPGQNIALVGHTGSGKTTIISLISKFYLPTRGQVLLDGLPIERIHTPSLHRRMGIVLQNNFLFTGTVMDNIRLGREGATDDEVREVVRRLDLMDVVDTLPEGLDTVVGERGAGLSIGQRQLFCFARALMADPRILILDEATSSIDTVTELRAQAALAKLLKGRTSFIVAHRLSTIRNADLVLVLDRGRIIERGRHEDLLSLGGTYARLYREFILATEA